MRKKSALLVSVITTSLFLNCGLQAKTNHKHTIVHTDWQEKDFFECTRLKYCDEDLCSYTPLEQKKTHIFAYSENECGVCIDCGFEREHSFWVDSYEPIDINKEKIIFGCLHCNKKVEDIGEGVQYSLHHWETKEFSFNEDIDSNTYSECYNCNLIAWKNFLIKLKEVE